MRIVWERSVYIGNAPVFCTVCGQQSYPVRRDGQQLVLAILYNSQGIAWGEACRDCVASGSEGIKLRLQERIHSLQTKLAELQTLAQEPVETPSIEQEFHIHRMESL